MKLTLALTKRRTLAPFSALCCQVRGQSCVRPKVRLFSMELRSVWPLARRGKSP